MKIHHCFRSLLSLASLSFLLSHCAPKNDVTPINVADIVGKWQLKTSKVVLKANINGKIETANQSRNGTAAEILDIKSNGTISDPSAIFGTGTYSWKYAIKGNELALGETGDIGYFTIQVTGTTMTWRMNLSQANRSLKETKGFSSIFNVDAQEFGNSLVELDMTIEFVKK